MILAEFGLGCEYIRERKKRGKASRKDLAAQAAAQAAAQGGAKSENAEDGQPGDQQSKGTPDLNSGRQNSTNEKVLNDLNTLVFDLLYRRDLTDKINFEAAALRKTQVSSFNLEGGNARLLSTGARARLEGRATEALKLAIGVNYQQLGFPIAVTPATTASGGVSLGQFAGERRKDHLYGFTFDASYQLTELVRSRFVYSFTRRDSTLPVLTYNRNRLSLVFEFGRRNETRGRPF